MLVGCVMRVVAANNYQVCFKRIHARLRVGLEKGDRTLHLAIVSWTVGPCCSASTFPI